MGQGATARVRKPRKHPWGLAKLAIAAGQEPKQMVIAALSRTATYEDAAAELGVSTRALLRYRRHYRIEG